MTTKTRILARIATHTPINAALLASDLRLSVATVKRHIKALTEEGQVSQAWDGVGVELTDAGRKEYLL